MSDNRRPDDPIDLVQEHNSEDVFDGSYRPVAKDKSAKSGSSKSPPKGGSGVSQSKKTSQDKPQDD